MTSIVNDKTASPEGKQLKVSLLVVASGVLCVLALPVYLMRLSGFLTSMHMMLWIFASAGALLCAVLLATVIRPKALLFPCHRIVDYYKATAILTLNALLLCAGLE